MQRYDTVYPGSIVEICNGDFYRVEAVDAEIGQLNYGIETKDAEIASLKERVLLEEQKNAARSGVNDRLKERVRNLCTMSTVEMMCENDNVRHHVEEWEKRCLKAEAESTALREALEWIREVSFNYSRSHLHVARDIYEVAKAALGQKEAINAFYALENSNMTCEEFVDKYPRAEKDTTLQILKEGETP